MASAALPRTTHAVSNIMVLSPSGNRASYVRSVATTHIFDVKRLEQLMLFDYCEHRLARVAEAWRIRRKKVVLLNDDISTVVDFFSV